MNNWVESILTLSMVFFFGILSIYMGIKAHREKIERDKDRSIPADYLPGAYEGAVEKGWWFFVLFGVIAIVVGFVEIFNNLFS